MHINPLSDVVVIRRQGIPEMVNGILILDSPDFQEDIGTIVFCGKGKVTPKGLIPMSVKKGDKVLFSTNGHQLTKINGEELIVLRQDSIIGIIND